MPSAKPTSSRAEPRVVRRVRELQAWSDAERAAGHRVALVPTMGALHAGHLSLVKEARQHAERVVVSIFVNPTQFNDAADFDAYPQDLGRDLDLCRSEGVDVVFAPAAAELYQDGAQTWVEVSELSRPLCGASRAGHFRGVTSVVTKLFLAARPHVAVFGEKDYQQLAVIRRMQRDLGFGIEIVGGATVREPDGLALSSRNVRLGPEARRQATALVRALDAAETAVAHGERRREVLLQQVCEVLAEAAQARVDYAELRGVDDLALAPAEISEPSLLALAVHFAPDHDGRGAEVRLIDNRVLRPQRNTEDR
jgi:pantoate--beta-alanine ligase